MTKDTQIRASAAANFLVVGGLIYLAYWLFATGKKQLAIALGILLVFPTYLLFFDFKFFSTKPSAWRRLTTGDEIMESKIPAGTA